MWAIAGVLLGLVVLASLLGFHVGPHAHLAAGMLGVLAAAWLVMMAVDGGPHRCSGSCSERMWLSRPASRLSPGKGSRPRELCRRVVSVSPVGADGVAVGVLNPSGIVRVNGEDWSAVAMNGTVPAGSPVQVLRVAGVRLEVWSDEALESSEPDELDPAISDNALSAEKAPW